MNSNFPSIPLTCENHVKTPFFITKYPPADVVEPTFTTGIGLHAHVVEQSGATQRAPRGLAHERHDDRAARVNNHDAHDDHAHPTRDDDRSATHLARDDERTVRELDRLDREAHRNNHRANARRQRVERRSGRANQSLARRRQYSSVGSGRLAIDDVEPEHQPLDLQRNNARRPNQFRRHESSELPTRDHLSSRGGVTYVATYSSSVRRFSTGPLQGIALALYFVLLPYVVVSKWSESDHQANGTIVRVLLVSLGVFWLTFLFQVVMNVVRLRRGTRLNVGGSAWLAGLVVALLPFLVSSSPSGASTYSATSFERAPHVTSLVRHPSPAPRHSLPPIVPLATPSLVPLALMAKRRYDEIHQHEFEASDDQVDEVIELLRHGNEKLLAQIRHLIGETISGVVEVPLDYEALPTSDSHDAVVVKILAHDEHGTRLAYAREGGVLTIPANESHDLTASSCIALHHGKIVFEDTTTGLLRSLATRAVRHCVVVYLGATKELDDELRASCITIKPIVAQQGNTTYQFAQASASAAIGANPSHDVLVELLRADPQITGIAEPFVATLRRRCIEMVAYLALHRNEPVTGDRLRTRVLNYANVDASSRTLANTASAVRKSLGSTSEGPRLHQVTSSGLYTTHGVSSDIETFHSLISRARNVASADAAPLAQEALQLIHGEPLASALRGFEWFLAEGYFARLQRDAEWASLVLHHEAMLQEQYELAFWSLRQGLLVDPYSDALSDALARVPRSRQFGGDGPGGAKDQTVSARGAVAVGWTFDRFTKQISQ